MRISDWSSDVCSSDLIADNRELLMRARTLAYDNRRLKTLLALRERTSDAVAVARIVSSSASSTRRFGLLNAGRRQGVHEGQPVRGRSEEHTSELQSLMRRSYAVFCLKKTKTNRRPHDTA